MAYSVFEHAGDEGMSNRDALLDALLLAARDSILANGLVLVGRDGRERVTIPKVDAEGRMANILRELDMIPRDEDELCAAQNQYYQSWREMPPYDNLGDSAARAILGEPRRAILRGASGRKRV